MAYMNAELNEMSESLYNAIVDIIAQSGVSAQVAVFVLEMARDTLLRQQRQRLGIPI